MWKLAAIQLLLRHAIAIYVGKCQLCLLQNLYSAQNDLTVLAAQSLNRFA